MSADQVEFSFVAEIGRVLSQLSGLESKMNQSAAITKADAKVIQDSINKIGDAKVRTAFLAPLFKDLKSAEKGVEETTHHIKDSLAEMIPGGGFTTKLGALLNPVVLGVAALGGAMLEGAIKAAEWSHEIEVAAQKLGVSTNYIQKMHGAALLAGVSAEKFDASFAKLNITAGKAVMGNKQAQEAFQRLGVSVRDSSGQVKSSEQIFDETRDALSKIESPAVRAAAAQAILGKGSKELGAVLAQNSAAWKQHADFMEKYATASDSAIEKSAALGQAGEALGQTFKAGIINAFAPLAEVLADLAKAVIPYVSDGFKILGQVVSTIIAEIKIAWAIFKALVSPLIDIIKVVANLVVGFLRWIGVIHDTGKSSQSFGQLFSQVMHNLNAVVAQVVGEIVGNFRWMSAQIHNIIAGVNNFIADSALGAKLGLSHMAGVDPNQAYKDGKAYGQNLVKGVMDVWKTGSKEKGERPGSTGDNGLGNSMAGDGKKKKEKTPKDDLVQQLDQQLEEMKTAWEKQQVAQGTHQEFSLKSEADFWDKALKRTDLSSKDRYQIEKKWISAEQAIQKDAFEKHIAQLDEEIQADKISWDKKLADLKKRQADIAAFYGAESKEARDAAKAVIAAQQQEQQAFAQKKQEAIDRQLELKDQQALLKGIKTQLQVKLDALNREHLKRLQLIRDSHDLSDADKADLTAIENNNAALDQQIAKQEDGNQKAEALAGVLQNLWENPKEAMKQFFANLIKQLLTAILKAIILKETLQSAMGGGGFGGLILGALGIGGKATGGSVSAGTPYRVGERGPELFVPGTSGNIVTNRALSGMGGGITLSPVYNITLSDNPQTNMQTLAQIKMQQRDQVSLIRQYNKNPKWSSSQ